MKKKLLSIGIIMAILLSACGNKQVASNETTLAKQAVETTNEEAKIKETEAVETVEETENIVEIKEEQEVEMSKSETTSSKGVLVAYFSATGTTRGVAKQIAELTNADIYEIVPANPYSDADLNWHDSSSRSSIEMNDKTARPEIGNEDIDISSYSKIYIGYPIWWGDAPRIMSTFVEKHNFDGKIVIPFCTSGGSGIGRSGSNLAALAGSGNWQNGERLSSGSVNAFVEKTK